MKKFTYLLILLMVVIGCKKKNSPSGPDDGEEIELPVENPSLVRHGNWEMYEGDDISNWVGDDSKGKLMTKIKSSSNDADIDTFQLDQPDNMSITMYRYGYDSTLTQEEQELKYEYSDFSFVLKFVDSTMHAGIFPDPAQVAIQYDSPFENTLAYNYSKDGELPYFQAFVPFKCDTTYNIQEKLKFDVMYAITDSNWVYVADGEGLVETADAIMCD